jgi:hypothetical protein
MCRQTYDVTERRFAVLVLGQVVQAYRILQALRRQAPSLHKMLAMGKQHERPQVWGRSYRVGMIA